MAAPPSHSDVQSLLSSASAYDPEVVPKLESYVRAQVSAVASTLQSDAQYSFDANRTLVKLYQFFPHLEGENGATLTSLAAFLALLQFPDTDFMALMCLVPERVQSREPCATLVRCAELLEHCQFSDFWPELRKLGIPEYGAEGEPVSEDRRLLSDAVNGASATTRLRARILRMLARTYRSAPLTMVLAALDMKDTASLEAFGAKVMLSAGGASGSENEVPIVEKVEGEFVTFAASADNSKRVGSAFKEGVSYEDVAAMMSKTAALSGQ